MSQLFSKVLLCGRSFRLDAVITVVIKAYMALFFLELPQGNKPCVV